MENKTLSCEGRKIHKNFRIQEDQVLHMEGQCKIYGINSSEYIRRLIDTDMGKATPDQTKEAFLVHKQMVYEINRIGNNINQIVKNVNMHYYTDYEKKKLFALMNKIIELYERREKMEPQMEAMLERLKSVENMEQMINLEDEIAKALGHGFLKGI